VRHVGSTAEVVVSKFVRDVGLWSEVGLASGGLAYDTLCCSYAGGCLGDMEHCLGPREVRLGVWGLGAATTGDPGWVWKWVKRVAGL